MALHLRRFGTYMPFVLVRPAPCSQRTRMKSHETALFDRIKACPQHLRSKLLDHALRNHSLFLLSAIPEHVVWRDALHARLIQGKLVQRVTAPADFNISDVPTRG